MVTAIRSGFVARASTLHQLTGWLKRSDGENTRVQAGAPVGADASAKTREASPSRGALMSSQHGPLIFLPRRRSSRKEALVPKMCENVEAFRSEGRAGKSACRKRNTRHFSRIRISGTSVPGYSRNIGLPGTRSCWERRGSRRRSSSPLSEKRAAVTLARFRWFHPRPAVEPLTFDLYFMILNFSESSLNSW